MGTPDQQEPEPISEQSFEAVVKKLLDTPPRPRGAKQRKPKRKPVPKPKPARSR